MIIPGLTAQDTAEVEQVLESLPEIERAWVFGSRAKGNYKTGSDVDLALEGEHLSFGTLREARYRLNEESYLPYHFDILDKSTVSSDELCNHLNRVALMVYKRKTL
ncbi:MAG: nucleotidyltransferase domain-containing protein [Spirochaetales bacterium]|nr:nucleotidyltransferase domain-containing protein [Spirochaetales bacterium]